MKNIFSQHEQFDTSSLPGIPVSFAGSLISLTTVGNYAEVLRRNLTLTSIDLTKNTHNSGTKIRRRTQIPYIQGIARKFLRIPKPEIRRVIVLRLLIIVRLVSLRFPPQRLIN